MKARLDENNNDSGDCLKLIRNAHNVKEKVIEDRMEDYLEVIYELIKKKGTTQTDISESLNISLPRVTKKKTTRRK